MKTMRLIGWISLLIWSGLNGVQAMEWQQLDLMRQAFQEQNYRGEYLHRRGDASSLYNIVHRYELGKSTELLKQLDGDMVEVLREGDRIDCFYPEGSEDALSHAVPAAPFSQVNALDLSRIAMNYKAVSLGMARVAGLQTHIIELVGDDWRYRHRLWLETETNLLLQSEIIGLDGEVLEQFRFARIELGVDIRAEELVPSLMDDQNARRQTVYRNEPEPPVEQGFLTRLTWLPEGYLLMRSSRKDMVNGWMEQRTYSDGLASFSIFLEKDDSRKQPAALAKMGATNALMQSENGLSVTVIGEIPVSTAKKIAQGLSVTDASL